MLISSWSVGLYRDSRRRCAVTGGSEEVKSCLKKSSLRTSLVFCVPFSLFFWLGDRVYVFNIDVKKEEFLSQPESN